MATTLTRAQQFALGRSPVRRVPVVRNSRGDVHTVADPYTPFIERAYRVALRELLVNPADLAAALKAGDHVSAFRLFDVDAFRQRLAYELEGPLHLAVRAQAYAEASRTLEALKRAGRWPMQQHARGGSSPGSAQATVALAKWELSGERVPLMKLEASSGDVKDIKWKPKPSQYPGGNWYYLAPGATEGTSKWVFVANEDDPGQVIAAAQAKLSGSTVEAPPPFPKPSSASYQFDFHTVNAQAVDAANTAIATLVTNVTAQQVQAIRDAIAKGFTAEIPPLKTAELLTSVVGLNAPQLASLQHFTDGLTEKAWKEYGKEQGQSWKGPLDSPPGTVLPDHYLDQIHEQALAYSQQQLEYRAKMIARTETVRASNLGQQALWDAAAEGGYLDTSHTRKRWSVAGDGCDFCQTLAELDPVELDDSFGDVDGPPAHPNCRCAAVLVFLPYAEGSLDSMNAAAEKLAEQQQPPAEEQAPPPKLPAGADATPDQFKAGLSAAEAKAFGQVPLTTEMGDQWFPELTEMASSGEVEMSQLGQAIFLKLLELAQAQQWQEIALAAGEDAEAVIGPLAAAVKAKPPKEPKAGWQEGDVVASPIQPKDTAAMTWEPHGPAQWQAVAKPVPLTELPVDEALAKVYGAVTTMVGDDLYFWALKQGLPQEVAYQVEQGTPAQAQLAVKKWLQPPRPAAAEGKVPAESIHTASDLQALFDAYPESKYWLAEDTLAPGFEHYKMWLADPNDPSLGAGFKKFFNEHIAPPGEAAPEPHQAQQPYVLSQIMQAVSDGDINEAAGFEDYVQAILDAGQAADLADAQALALKDFAVEMGDSELGMQSYLQQHGVEWAEAAGEQALEDVSGLPPAEQANYWADQVESALPGFPAHQEALDNLQALFGGDPVATEKFLDGTKTFEEAQAMAGAAAQPEAAPAEQLPPGPDISFFIANSNSTGTQWLQDYIAKAGEPAAAKNLQTQWEHWLTGATGYATHMVEVFKAWKAMLPPEFFENLPTAPAEAAPAEEEKKPSGAAPTAAQELDTELYDAFVVGTPKDDLDAYISGTFAKPEIVDALKQYAAGEMNGSQLLIAAKKAGATTFDVKKWKNDIDMLLAAQPAATAAIQPAEPPEVTPSQTGQFAGQMLVDKVKELLHTSDPGLSAGKAPEWPGKVLAMAGDVDHAIDAIEEAVPSSAESLKATFLAHLPPEVAAQHFGTPEEAPEPPPLEVAEPHFPKWASELQASQHDPGLTTEVVAYLYKHFVVEGHSVTAEGAPLVEALKQKASELAQSAAPAGGPPLGTKVPATGLPAQHGQVKWTKWKPKPSLYTHGTWVDGGEQVGTTHKWVFQEYGQPGSPVAPPPAVAKPVAEPTPAPTPPKPPAVLPGQPSAIPETFSDLEAMKKIPGPHGSQAGQWYEDSGGNQFYVKPAQSIAHAYNEVGTMRAYEAAGLKAGVDIPYTNVLLDAYGKPYIVSEKLSGLEVKSASWWQSSAGQQSRDIASKGWGVDVLLAHYDVGGAALDNLLVDSAGIPVRVEGGAGMAFRAMGDKKPGWTATDAAEKLAADANSMRGLNGNAQLKAVFGHLTDQQAGELLVKAAQAFDLAKLDKAWSELGMPQAQRQANLKVLQARVDAAKVVAEHLGYSAPAPLPVAAPVAPTQAVGGPAHGTLKWTGKNKPDSQPGGKWVEQPSTKAGKRQWVFERDDFVAPAAAGEVPSRMLSLQELVEGYSAGTIHPLQGYSVAYDHDSIEDLNVRTYRLKNLGGQDGYGLRFKLTESAARTLKASLAGWKAEPFKVLQKIRGGSGFVQSPEAQYYGAGHTYVKTLADGTQIRFHAPDEGAAFENMVEVWAPNLNEATMQSLMSALGAPIGYPGPAEVRKLAEERLFYVFNPKAPRSGPGRQQALEQIKAQWGVTPDELELRHGADGRIELRLPEAVARKISEKYGVTAFVHSVTGGNLHEILLGAQKSLLSTVSRWSEGIGVGGMSSSTDVHTGGAHYLFTRQGTYDMFKGGREGEIVMDAVRMLQRTDYYAYNHDRYGKNRDSEYKNRTLDDLRIPPPSGRNGRWIGRETDFKDRVGWEDIEYVIVDDPVALIRKLRAQGIQDFAGRPLAEVIVGRGTPLTPRGGQKFPTMGAEPLKPYPVPDNLMGDGPNEPKLKVPVGYEPQKGAGWKPGEWVPGGAGGGFQEYVWQPAPPAAIKTTTGHEVAVQKSTQSTSYSYYAYTTGEADKPAALFPSYVPGEWSYYKTTPLGAKWVWKPKPATV